MKYSITFREEIFDALLAHSRASANEQAAYLFGSISTEGEDTRILIREFMPVEPRDVVWQTPFSIEIRSASYVRAIKHSAETGMVFIFAHTHPQGPDSFSVQDDTEELALTKVAHIRNPQRLHATLVIARHSFAAARVWSSDGKIENCERIRVIGKRWKWLFANSDDSIVPEHFDRQVRAFGAPIQRLLSELHVGIVGAGGTGSAVAEQLIRLGVGKLTIIDHDKFAATNANRVYGSAAFDTGLPKPAIVARNAAHIGLKTEVVQIPQHLSFRSVARALRSCEVVFGCTDDNLGRSILNRLALDYLIPVLDVAVSIDRTEEVIRSVHGRLTILQPGNACLYCRGRISAKAVADESLWQTDPSRAAELVKEGYVTGLAEPAPAVVAFTSAIASAAVGEFLDRIIGFKSSEPKSSEFLYRFDADTIGRSSIPSKSDCFCADANVWGLGDRKRFLGLNWRAEI